MYPGPSRRNGENNILIPPMRLNLFLLANLSRSDSSSASTRASSRATLSSRFFLAINSSDGLGGGGGGGGGGGAVTVGVVTVGVVVVGVSVVVVVTGAAFFFRFIRPDINQTSPLNNSQPLLGHTFLIYTLHQNIVIWQTLLLSDGHILQLFAS